MENEEEIVRIRIFEVEEIPERKRSEKESTRLYSFCILNIDVIIHDDKFALASNARFNTRVLVFPDNEEELEKNDALLVSAGNSGSALSYKWKTARARL